jgi:hypothetical protein
MDDDDFHKQDLDVSLLSKAFGISLLTEGI